MGVLFCWRMNTYCVEDHVVSMWTHRVALFGRHFLGVESYNRYWTIFATVFRFKMSDEDRDVDIESDVSVYSTDSLNDFD